MKTIKLGTLAGLKVMARPSAVFSTLLLWLILSGVGRWALDLPAGQAVLGGLLATVLHWLGELWHHLGHAWAARRTGYPMSGVMMVWLLAASLYPRDEGTLPGHIHIRRALGGPTGSLLLALAAAALLLALAPLSGTVWWYVALFFFLENLLIFTLGAFLPLGFTDGSTLLAWWGKP
jgi:hypothetical protein